MIRVTVDHTLGPEADIPALLEKIVLRLGELGPPARDDPTLVEGREVTGFARGAGDWEILHIRLSAPAPIAETFGEGLLEALLALADDHLAELGARRWIALAADLETPSAQVQRLRPRPADAPSF